jgi:hypothetical protein
MKCPHSSCDFATDDREDWENHINEEHEEIADFFDKEGTFYGAIRLKHWNGISDDVTAFRGIRKVENQKWNLSLFREQKSARITSQRHLSATHKRSKNKDNSINFIIYNKPQNVNIRISSQYTI